MKVGFLYNKLRRGLLIILVLGVCMNTYGATAWTTISLNTPARVGCQAGSYDITLLRNSSGSGWYSSALNATVTITFNASTGVDATTCTGGTHNGTAVSAASMTLTSTTITYNAPVAVAEGTTFHIILNGITHGNNIAAGTITVSIPCATFGPLSGTTNTYTTSAGSAPTASAAGSDQGVCGTTATLAGNTPATGTGTWTLVSGSGTITTPSSPTSGITGLATGDNTFRWTISNYSCGTSTDDVIITEGGTAATSSSCVTNGNTVSLSLSRYPGTLQWQKSVNGGAYSNIAGATTTPYTTPAMSSINTYSYRAVVTSGGCSDNSTVVMVDCGDACTGVCSRCTWCNTSVSGCTWTVSSNSSTDYTVNSTGSQKLCITGGTYTGDITLQGGTVVVSGGTFNPASITLGIFDVYGGTLEIQSGVTSSTLPAISYNGSDPFTINNCCNSVTLGGDLSINGSGVVNINNNGQMLGTTRDILFNGAGTFCNGSYATVSVNDFTANGTAGSSINNQGTFLVSGNFIQNSSCPMNLCRSSLIIVTGSFTSTGGTINGPYSCGAIQSNGASSCTGCVATGSFDFCDGTAGSQHFDSQTGATIAGTVTHCSCSALPIELLSFTGKLEEKNVLLKWTTASEINNDYFTLERGIDAQNFETIGTVRGAGNSTHTIDYNFTDKSLEKGIYYYRLKQTDYDGKYVYSRIIAFDLNSLQSLKLLYLFADQNQTLQYQISSPENKALTVEVVDVLGKIILSKKIGYEEDHDQLFNMDATSLCKGVYLFKVSDGTNVVMKKFLY